MSHASKDHVVKVANEADFILNRMRADDVRKASEFEQMAQQTTIERIEEEHLCDHFIQSSFQRYLTTALRLEEKYLWLMIYRKEDYLNCSSPGWKLDPWEDDLRRRRRLTRNSTPIQYDRDDFTSEKTTEKVLNTSRQEEFLLRQSKKQQQQQKSSNQQEEEDLSQVDEKEVEIDHSAPIRFSTNCSLICGTAAIRGTLALTYGAMLFNADEENYVIDDKLVPYLDNLHSKWSFTDIRAIFSRRYLLQDRALEIFVSNRSETMKNDEFHLNVSFFCVFSQRHVRFF